eukprot:281981-Lingulodinium_polyedra.AAC.1
MAATNKRTLCHGFAGSASGCSHDSAACGLAQAASAPVDEQPPVDAEPFDGEGGPDWGHACVDRRFTKIHANCGRVHPRLWLNASERQ